MEVLDMIVREQFKMLADRFIEIDYSGSGNPAEEHDIVGITIRDRDGNKLMTIGKVDIPDKTEYRDVI